MGSILPINGEDISPLDLLKNKILNILEQYNIEHITVTDDAPLTEHLLSISSNLKIFTLQKPEHVSSDISTSDYFFWSNKQYWNQALLKATIQPLKTAGCIIFLICMSIIAIICVRYFTLNNNVLLNKPTHSSDRINNNQPQYVLSTTFMKPCLLNIDLFLHKIDGWKIDSITCDMSHRVAVISNHGGYIQTLKTQLPIFTEHLIYSPVKTLTITTPIIVQNKFLGKLPPENKMIMMDNLQHDTQEINAKLSWKNDQEFILITNFSPKWLYDHHMIDHILLAKIILKINNSGFLEWTLWGKIP